MWKTWSSRSTSLNALPIRGFPVTWLTNRPLSSPLRILEYGWPVTLFVCSPSGRGSTLAVVVAVVLVADSVSADDFASTFAKLLTVCLAAVRSDGVPPVLAAATAWVESIIGLVIGRGGANLSRPPRARTRRAGSPPRCR
jgi:hypothetical protein